MDNVLAHISGFHGYSWELALSSRYYLTIGRNNRQN